MASKSVHLLLVLGVGVGVGAGFVVAGSEWRVASAQEVLAAPPVGAVSTAAAAAAAAASSAGPAETTSPDARDLSEERPGERGPRGPSLGAGGADLLEQLRQRLHVEEQRRADLVREHDERALSQLMAEIRNPATLRLVPGEDETQGEVFLRAVSLPDPTYARVRRRGLDKLAMREALKEFKRMYRRDQERRNGIITHYDFDRAMADEDNMRFALGSDRVVWERPFPMYWDGHPSAHEIAPITQGERIDVFRVGRLTFDNELRLRYDVRSIVIDGDREPDNERRNGRSRPRHADPDVERTPGGSLYSGEFFTVSGRVALQGINVKTGVLKTIAGRLDWVFFDPYDRKEVFEVCLEHEFNPGDASHEVSVLFSLAKF